MSPRQGGVSSAVTIDAGATGEPISRYIYGQFIEHMGRCIHDGIWSEMVDDRKFYYPVGAEGSPWRVVDGAVVTMVARGAFVGEHTPQIRLSAAGGGIAHGGLGLVKGKDYVGRILLAGDADAAPVRVSLVWGPGPANRQAVAIDGLTDDYAEMPLGFTAGGDTDDGQLEIVGSGPGAFRVGAVSVMPGDNVHGMRADTLEVLRALDSPIYRWPGGNFVSGYDWRDAIGDPDRRPPRKNPAWEGIEQNDFGLDEFMVLCRELGTEPLIVVNSGQGDATMAVELVAYANGGPDTPMGRLRAENGHPEPYCVTWWGVGNEMYGDWQLGHMPLADYVTKHNAFAKAMRAADPSIKLIAVGATGEWSEQMMTHCADHMDLISEHFYSERHPDLLAHVRQMAQDVQHKADAHRDYRRRIPRLAEKDIRIALDEWNYPRQLPDVYGYHGTRYTLRDALGVAAGLNAYVRNSDIMFMANFAQTVNVIGCVKTTKTAAGFSVVGLPLMLYRREFGAVPVTVTGEPGPLDVAAAWRDDRKTLTIAVVNPTHDDVSLGLELRGASLTGNGRVWRIMHESETAYNEPGKPPQVPITEEVCRGVSDRLEAPAISISLYALETE